MAETAKELAFVLFDEGKRPSDPEIKALGLKGKTTYNYYQQWKKTLTEGEDTTSEERDTTSGGAGDTTPRKPGGTTSAKPGTPTTPITVGKITITPENWGMTQYGAILVLDTYNKAKRDLDYGGTIGDFICDICEFWRRMMNYREVEYGRETGDGGGGAEKDGPKSSEPALRLTEG